MKPRLNLYEIYTNKASIDKIGPKRLFVATSACEDRNIKIVLLGKWFKSL